MGLSGAVRRIAAIRLPVRLADNLPSLSLRLNDVSLEEFTCVRVGGTSSRQTLPCGADVDYDGWDGDALDITGANVTIQN
jgi:hypothetical protein